MKKTGDKFDRAFAEMMTRAARQAGFKGELEITILRPKKHEEIRKSRRASHPHLHRRASVPVQ